MVAKNKKYRSKLEYWIFFGFAVYYYFIAYWHLRIKTHFIDGRVNKKLFAYKINDF